MTTLFLNIKKNEKEKEKYKDLRSMVLFFGGKDTIRKSYKNTAILEKL